MTVKTIGRSKGLAFGVLAAFVVFMTPTGLGAETRGAATKSGSLAGFVFAKDMKTPVAGAVVKIRDVANAREIQSQPTDTNGMYAIPEIPAGRYVLGVTAAESDFDFEFALNLKAGETGKLTLALAPPGSGQEAGEASQKKKGFFNTTAGRVVIVAAIGVGLAFLLLGKQEEATPIR